MSISAETQKAASENASLKHIFGFERNGLQQEVDRFAQENTRSGL